MTTGYDEEESYLRERNLGLSQPTAGPYGGYGTRALGDPTLRKFLYSQQREGGEEAFQRQKATFKKQDRRQPPPQPAPQSAPPSLHNAAITALAQQMHKEAEVFKHPESFSTASPPILFGSQSPSLPTSDLYANFPNPNFPTTNKETGLLEDPRMRAWEPAQVGRWTQPLTPQQNWVRLGAEQEMFDTPPAGSQTMPYARFSQLYPWMGPTFDPGYVPWERGHDSAQREQDFRTLDWILGLGPPPLGVEDYMANHPSTDNEIFRNSKGMYGHSPESRIALGTWY